MQDRQTNHRSYDVVHVAHERTRRPAGVYRRGERRDNCICEVINPHGDEKHPVHRDRFAHSVGRRGSQMVASIAYTKTGGTARDRVTHSQKTSKIASVELRSHEVRKSWRWGISLAVSPAYTSSPAACCRIATRDPLSSSSVDGPGALVGPGNEVAEIMRPRYQKEVPRRTRLPRLPTHLGH